LFTIGKKRRELKREELTVFDRIETIAYCYELTGILRLCAYVLSKRKAPFEGLESKESILKHFKQLGLSNNDRENIRLIRNAHSHKFSIIENGIVTSEGKKIEVDIITNLQERVEKIFSWWFTIFVFNLIFIPRLGLLVLMGLYISINNNKDEWDEYGKGLEIFFSDIVEENRREKEKKKSKWKYKISRLKYKIKIFLKYRVLNKVGIKTKDDFFFENATFVMTRLEHHIGRLIQDVKYVLSRVDSEEDKVVLEKLANWLEKNETEIAEVVDFQRAHPEEFQEKLMKWKSK
jgi:hypothetical protein